MRLFDQERNAEDFAAAILRDFYDEGLDLTDPDSMIDADTAISYTRGRHSTRYRTQHE